MKSNNLKRCNFYDRNNYYTFFGILSFRFRYLWLPTFVVFQFNNTHKIIQNHKHKFQWHYSGRFNPFQSQPSGRKPTSFFFVFPFDDLIKTLTLWLWPCTLTRETPTRERLKSEKPNSNSIFYYSLQWAFALLSSHHSFDLILNLCLSYFRLSFKSVFLL